MQIEERSAGDVTLLDLKGKMTLGEGDETLKDKINSLVHQGRKKLVLNLAEVPYMDSSAIAVLVEALQKIRKLGGKIFLTNLQPRVKGLLEIARLDTIFGVTKDEAEAMSK